MSEKHVMVSVIGFFLGLQGILILLYPNRSPFATQLYIAGSIMILIGNFVYMLSESPRSRVRTAKTGKSPRPKPPGTPQPKPKNDSSKKKENIHLNGGA